ncbi:hypothetical protein BH24ACT7_BH24ACT7_23420 [soil metagenome]
MTRKTAAFVQVPSVEVQHGRLALVARYLVDSGKVVSSLTVDGQARSVGCPFPGWATGT